MKTLWLCLTVVATLCFSVSVVRGQDSAAGEKLFKAKCAGCHGTDAAGKACRQIAFHKRQDGGRDRESHFDFAEACQFQEAYP